MPAGAGAAVVDFCVAVVAAGDAVFGGAAVADLTAVAGAALLAGAVAAGAAFTGAGCCRATVFAACC